MFSAFLPLSLSPSHLCFPVLEMVVYVCLLVACITGSEAFSFFLSYLPVLPCESGFVFERSDYWNRKETGVFVFYGHSSCSIVILGNINHRQYPR